jgi:ABC-type branched-subunit amino acid transport system substrate-binding protein
MIKVGQTLPMKGNTAPNGQAVLEGTKAYFKRINDAGGVHGRKLDLVAVDDGYEPENTIKAYEKMMKETPVMALLTVYGAPNTQAILPAIEKEGVPLLGPITSANLTDPVRKNIFMVRKSGYDNAKALVDKAVGELGIKDFAIFAQDDAFGSAGKSGAMKALATHGLSLKAAGTYKRNTSDVDEAVKAMVAAKPKAIVMAGLAPATIEFVKKVKAAGLNPVFLGIPAVSAPAFLKAASELKLTYFSSLDVPLADDPEYALTKQFQTDMNAAGFSKNSNHIYAIEGYVNALIFVEGVKRAGKDLSREKFRTALETIKDFDIGGIKVTFSPTDHKGLEDIIMSKLEGDRLVPVKALKLSKN